MITKKMSLALALFSVQIITSAELDKKEKKFRTHVEKMDSTCKALCPTNDKECINTCFDNHISQYHNFLIRKSIGKCNWGFAEKFSFKTGDNAVFYDLLKTSEAMDQLQDPTVRTCSERYLARYYETMDQIAYK